MDFELTVATLLKKKYRFAEDNNIENPSKVTSKKKIKNTKGNKREKTRFSFI